MDERFPADTQDSDREGRRVMPAGDSAAQEQSRQLALAAAHPRLVVAVQRKDARAGKVLLDWSQNHPAKTTITPWSLRGRERPTVAAPRYWDEIAPGLQQLTAHEAAARLARDGDPFDA